MILQLISSLCSKLDSECRKIVVILRAGQSDVAAVCDDLRSTV